MRFTYTAIRSVTSGHVLDDVYTLAIYAASLTQRDEPKRVQNVALDGTEENLLHRIDVLWNITTDWVDVGTPFDELLEFLRSVSAGEVFTFDPWAYTSDVDPLDAKLVPGTLTYSRVATNLDAYTVSFSVRMVDAIL